MAVKDHNVVIAMHVFSSIEPQIVGLNIWQILIDMLDFDYLWILIKLQINEPDIDLEFQNMCTKVAYSSPRVFKRFFKGS
jgi:hypothetical protein